MAVQQPPPLTVPSLPQPTVSYLDIAPRLKMPTINLPTFDGTGHVHDFLDKFRNFRVANGLTEQQIVRLLFNHLKGNAGEWYAAKVGASPSTNWKQVVKKFSSHYEGGPPNEGGCNSQHPQDGKRSEVTNYFMHVMWLCKDIDLNMPDDLQ